MAFNKELLEKVSGTITKLIEQFNIAIDYLKSATNIGAIDTVKEKVEGESPSQEEGAKVEPLNEPTPPQEPGQPTGEPQIPQENQKKVGDAVEVSPENPEELAEGETDNIKSKIDEVKDKSIKEKITVLDDIFMGLDESNAQDFLNLVKSIIDELRKLLVVVDQSNQDRYKQILNNLEELSNELTKGMNEVGVFEVINESLKLKPANFKEPWKVMSSKIYKNHSKIADYQSVNISLTKEKMSKNLEKAIASISRKRNKGA